MLRQLLAPSQPQVAQGYARNNGTLYHCLSTNSAADTTPKYMGHVDIPADALSGLSSDWHANIKVLYESGVYGGVSPDAAPTGTANVMRRFHIRISPDLTLDPTNIGNSIGMTDPAERAVSIGGQLSVDITAVAGTMGCEVRCTSSWNTQSDFLTSPLALSRWIDGYAQGGLRVCVFFNWEASTPLNTIMKVVSTSVTMVPGATLTLVTSAAPRTLTLPMFGGHWNTWPVAASNGANPPFGVLAGGVRDHDYSSDIVQAAYGTWPMTETLNWSTLTVAQQNADPGWATVDRFVAKHASRRKILTLNATPSFYAADRRLPPNDLAAGVNSSWYRFCTRIGTRFAGQGIYYEIWNEPNLPGNPYIGWNGTQAELVTMVTLGAQALRAVDPSCKIIGPSFVNLIDRGGDLNYTTTKAFYALSGGAALAAVDMVAFHAYPLASGNPLSALLFLKKLRQMMTELGAPTKPIYMTEMSTENPAYAAFPLAQRRAFLQRSMITLLCGDPYIQGFCWYGMDHNTLYFTQDDADAWNDVATFMTSGPVTMCRVNPDGSVGVTVGGVSRVF